eukprot:scaffold81103_cov28-Tisochrysis_lutea.AAC.6
MWPAMLDQCHRLERRDCSRRVRRASIPSCGPAAIFFAAALLTAVLRCGQGSAWRRQADERRSAPKAAPAGCRSRTDRWATTGNRGRPPLPLGRGSEPRQTFPPLCHHGAQAAALLAVGGDPKHVIGALRPRRAVREAGSSMPNEAAGTRESTGVSPHV